MCVCEREREKKRIRGVKKIKGLKYPFTFYTRFSFVTK